MLWQVISSSWKFNQLNLSFFLFPFLSLGWNRQQEGPLQGVSEILERAFSCTCDLCLHIDREGSWRDFVGQIEGGGLNVVWTSCIFKTRKLWILEILPCSYDTNSFDSFPSVSITWEVMHKLVQSVPCNTWCEKQCKWKTLVTGAWRTLSFEV